MRNLVENFKVGADKSGWIRKPAAAYPRLIYASITGFGRTALAHVRLWLYHPGHGPDEPYRRVGRGAWRRLMKVRVAVADLFSGMYTASAILAALWRERRARAPRSTWRFSTQLP
jgi:crotonobetainyl-CoA:carnitine CoA-transferase CaiB-like acyl-CoA transferase